MVQEHGIVQKMNTKYPKNNNKFNIVIMEQILPVDKNFNSAQALYIGKATDVTDTTVAAGKTRIIRISAITDCRIWAYKETKEGDGLNMPEGTIEYFGIPEGYILEIEGSANVMG